MGLKPDTKLQMIAVDDIGKFGLMLFDHPDTMNRIELDIAGDAHTMPEIAGFLGHILKNRVEFQQVSKDDVRKFSEDYAIMLEWFDRVGYDVHIDRLEATFGIRLTKFEEWAKQMNWTVSRAA